MMVSIELEAEQVEAIVGAEMEYLVGLLEQDDAEKYFGDAAEYDRLLDSALFIRDWYGVPKET